MSVQLKNKTEVHAHISRASSQGNIFNFHLHSREKLFQASPTKTQGNIFRRHLAITTQRRTVLSPTDKTKKKKKNTKNNMQEAKRNFQYLSKNQTRGQRGPRQLTEGKWTSGRSFISAIVTV